MSEYRQARYPRHLLIEEHSKERMVEENPLPESIARKEAPLIPDVPEYEVARHFTRLSQMNYGIDTGFYPLGSCTMKYNPKYTEMLAKEPKATGVHPLQPEEDIQGCLRIMYELQRMLAEIGGMSEVTLQPAAGAQGEMTGLAIVHEYHKNNGNDRTEVVLPDTAHGTNPATAAMLGYKTIEIPSDDGCVDLKALEEAVGEDTAAFMLTNPNTLGIFEEDVLEIADIVHDAGALLYYDGANLNAIMGKSNPGAMNFDIMHFNLHKTFSSPHGGGGPGSGPVGVCEKLRSYLPVPIVTKKNDRYHLDHSLENTIGRVKGFYGNWSVLLRTYAYLVYQGKEGLEKSAERAVLNSNYLRKLLEDHLELPYRSLRKHEFVLSGRRLKDKGLKTVDLAKRLADHGYHAPTIYFPLIVEEALMIEPTETERKETLDNFADTVKKILDEDPEIVKSAPHNTAVKRVDETKAAKKPVVSFRMRGR